MRTANLTSVCVLASAILFPLAAGAQSLNPRTYVSGLGADNSTCAVANPCRTLKTALAVTAPGGEIHVLNSADYGPLVINKSITITSEGAVAGILAPSGTAIVVSAGPADVVSLRGLEVDGNRTAGIGIQFNSGQSLNIQKSVFRGFMNAAVYFGPASGGTFFVSDTLIANNPGNGFAVAASQGNMTGTLSRVTVSANGGGLYALGAKASLTLTDSVATGNTYGIVSNAAAIMVRNSSISGNIVGIFADQNGIIRVGQSALTANTTGTAFSAGAQVQSFGNNTIAGNKIDGTMSSVIALR